MASVGVGAADALTLRASGAWTFPVGINIRLPSGPLAGQRFGVEAVWTDHEDTHGPRIASDWTVSVGWQGTFSVTGF